jgi:hypothetical protein
VKNAVLGSKSTIELVMKDSDGKGLIGGKNRFRMEIESPGSGNRSSSSGEITEGTDGRYIFSFTPNTQGQYRVFIYFDGNLVQPDPFLFSCSSSSSSSSSGGGSSSSSSSGSGDQQQQQQQVAPIPAQGFDFKGFRNQTLKFTIHIQDHDGKPVIGGTGDLKVTIDGPEKLSASVVDNFNGQYSISFKPTVIGEFRISASYKNQLVQGRAFICRIEESSSTSSSSSSSSSSVGSSTGAGAGAGVATSSGKIKVSVQFDARDQTGKLLINSADKFTVKVTDPDGKTLSYRIEEGENARYTLFFDAERKGEYTVTVLLGSWAVARKVFNPFDGNSSSGSSSGGQKSSSSSSTSTSTPTSLLSSNTGTGEKDGSVICSWSFSVQVLDSNGNPDVHDRSEFKVQVESPDPSLVVNVKEKGNGKYKISYDPKVHGDYAVHVLLRGAPIKGSPFRQSF